MRVTITGATVEVGNVIYVQPDGKRTKVKITVTEIGKPDAYDQITITGIRASGLPVTATVLSYQPISWEVNG